MSDDSPPDSSRPASRVPSGRWNRLLQLGATASRMAAGGAAEKMKRLAGRVEAELPHALLTAKNAQLLAQRLARLRGAAMKVGQMLSMEGDNLLPPEFAKALEVLRSSAHHMPESQVREVLTREFGPNFSERFGSFELKPMASASIGQVHRATTKDGEPLALKIQYPGVAESIDSDVDNLRSLLSLTRLAPADVNLDELTAEVKRELHNEVDYARELTQLLAYQRAVGEHPGLRIPRAYPDLSTHRVLALERMPGLPLLDWSKTARASERDHAASLLFELLLRELFEFGLMQTDPNPANYFFDPESQQLILLDFGATREVPPETRELYKNAFRGIKHRDAALLHRVIDELGIATGDSPELKRLVIELAFEAAEIFEQRPFDFRASDLSERLNKKSQALLEYQRELKPPPPAYIFFQRKLGGTFLLCRNLEARVDCDEIVSRFDL